MKRINLSFYLEAPPTVLSKFLVARRKIQRKAKFPNKTSISIYNWSGPISSETQHKIQGNHHLFTPNTDIRTFANLQNKEEKLMDKPHSSSLLVKTSILSQMIRLCLYIFCNEFKELQNGSKDKIKWQIDEMDTCIQKKKTQSRLPQ